MTVSLCDGLIRRMYVGRERENSAHERGTAYFARPSRVSQLSLALGHVSLPLVRLLSLSLACCSLLPSPPSPLAFSFRSAIRRGATWPCQPHDAYALLERWRSRRRLRRLPPPLPPLHPRAPPIPRQLPRRNPSKRRGVAGRRGRLNRLWMTLRRRPFLLPPPRGRGLACMGLIDSLTSLLTPTCPLPTSAREKPMSPTALLRLLRPPRLRWGLVPHCPQLRLRPSPAPLPHLHCPLPPGRGHPRGKWTLRLTRSSLCG